MPDPLHIHVPHLGGIDVGYKMHPYDPQKPTIVLVPPYSLEKDIFCVQFEDKELTNTANLIAIDPLSHGCTRATRRDTWTYWDSAEMNLQVLDGLSIDKVFVLGCAQGGWICVRMALMEPDRILGMILIGTTLDCESAEFHSRGCWDGPTVLTPLIDGLSTPNPTPDFVIEPEFCDMIFDSGLGDMVKARQSEFWQSKFRQHYGGDEGRRRLRMACINARDRDGLQGRVRDVQCPVLWLHGSEDVVISVEQAKHEVKMFTGSPSVKLDILTGGKHFLNHSHWAEVDGLVVPFVRAYYW